MNLFNLRYLIFYLAVFSQPKASFASVLPYSPDLGEEAIRQQVKDDLKTIVVSTLLDHPGQLQGLSVDRVKVTVVPEILFNEESGFVLHHADVQVAFPEGSFNLQMERDSGSLLERFLQESLNKEEAIPGEAEPATFTISLGSYHPVQRSLVRPLRQWGIAAGTLAFILLLYSLRLSFFRRRSNSVPVKTPAIQKHANKQHKASAINHEVSQSRRQLYVEQGRYGAASEDQNSTATPIAQVAEVLGISGAISTHNASDPTEKGWLPDEALPQGSKDALSALALMPLEEAIDVLAKFDQTDRRSIIEHLPLHPALKLRLRKGMAANPANHSIAP